MISKTIKKIVSIICSNMVYLTAPDVQKHQAEGYKLAIHIDY